MRSQLRSTLPRFAARFAAAACVILSFAATGQTAIERGDIAVHYSAIPSTTLAPEVARQYAITRSAGRALLNIAVLKRGADAEPRAITARISGAATNPNGQRQTLALREVREGDAIYYLAEPRIAARDTLDFELSVIPDGATAPIEVRFRQEFFPASR
jgi:hypothetical protein